MCYRWHAIDGWLHCVLPQEVNFLDHCRNTVPHGIVAQVSVKVVNYLRAHRFPATSLIYRLASSHLLAPETFLIPSAVMMPSLNSRLMQMKAILTRHLIDWKALQVHMITIIAHRKQEQDVRRS